MGVAPLPVSIGAEPGGGWGGGLEPPLDSKMAHRRNTNFRAEPPPRTTNLPINFEKFGAPASTSWVQGSKGAMNPRNPVGGLRHESAMNYGDLFVDERIRIPNLLLGVKLPDLPYSRSLTLGLRRIPSLAFPSPQHSGHF